MSDIKNIIKVFRTRLISSSSTIWNTLTINQLQFKFNALKNGIEQNKSSDANLFNIRRNIHRLEKGLSYANLKDSFAKEYIYATVIGLKKILAVNEIDNSTKSWAIAVLSLYFNVIKSDSEVILNSKKIFLEIIQGVEILNEIPYKSSERPTSSITYNELLNLSIRRRSVRYFSKEPVSIDLIEKAYEIAKYSPSACNRQAFQFLFFNEPKTVKSLSEIPGGVAGYTLPSIIVVLGRYDGYFDVRDINAPVIDSSLAIMSFLYAAETLQLGTVCINWPNLTDRERKIRKILDIKPYEFVVMMIGIGHPLEDGKIPYSGKRPSNQVVLFNERINL